MLTTVVERTCLASTSRCFGSDADGRLESTVTRFLVLGEAVSPTERDGLPQMLQPQMIKTESKRVPRVLLQMRGAAE